MQTLNPSQKEAVCHRSSPLLVLSGPGTGKTRVLVERIKHLIFKENVQPASILAITFTVNAATEILKRLRPEHHIETQPMVTTFHGWAYSFLKEQGKKIDIIGEKEEDVLLREALSQRGLKQTSAPAMLKQIACAMQRYPITFEQASLEDVFRGYKKLKNTYNLASYDDLIHEAIDLLRQPSINSEFRKRFRFILVDEFQDINPVQYEIVRLMAWPDGEITAIGDPNQAIYSFRGSAPQLIQDFQQDFGCVKTVVLDTSYRTPQGFLNAACAVLKENGQRLCSTKSHGPLIEHMVFEDEKTEANWITGIIASQCGLSLETMRGDEHRQFSDFAVLSRLNSVCETIANQMQKKGIPCQTRSNFMAKMPWLEPLAWTWRTVSASTQQKNNFFLQMATKEITHMKKEQKDLSTSILKAAISFVQNHDPADTPKQPVELFDLLVTALNLDFVSGIEAIVLKSVREMLWTMPQIVDLEPLLKDDVSVLGIKSEAVRFLTLHGAKGMEFPVVIVAGLEEGILPLHGADINEERRLLYVGMTRACERLYLTSVKHRKLHGQAQPLLPSRFLADMPAGLFSCSAEKGKVKKKQVYKKLF